MECEEKGIKIEFITIDGEADAAFFFLSLGGFSL